MIDVALLLLTSVLLALWWRQTGKPAKFPPGPPRLPVVGSIPYLAKWKSLLEKISNLSKEYGPVCGFYICDTPTVILSDLETVKRVFKMEEMSARPPMALLGKHRYSSEAGYGSKGLLFSSGEEWREQRRFALKTLRDFGFGKTSMETMISHEVAKLCGYLKNEANKPISLDAKLNIAIVSALWIILVGEELDLENEKANNVVETINHVVRKGSVAETPLAILFPRLCRTFPHYFNKEGMAMFRQMKDMVGEYRKQHRDTFDPDNLRDFLDVHIDAQLSAQPGSSFHGLDGLQHEEVNLIDLFLAGTETTSSTITWGILYMLHHPEVQAKVHMELDNLISKGRLPTLEDEPRLPYLQAVLEEVQRCASIVFAGVPHYTVADVAVDEYIIPEGTRVFANLLQIMRNPDIFPEPERFNPDRFLTAEGQFVKNQHVIPFAVGKRVCLGSSLAEKELFLFFSALLHTFTFKPVPGQKLPSYDSTDRNAPPTNGIIRVCPRYQLIVTERNV